MTTTRRATHILLLALLLTSTAWSQRDGADRESQATAKSKQMFKQADKDGDGKLTREEFPEQFRRAFDRIDTDKDGAVSLEEDIAYRTQRTRGAQQQNQRQGPRPKRPEPDHADVKYGPHERNVFDIWLAKSDKPTPLVIFYHGGGFRGGDKRAVDVTLLNGLLENGVSFAASNYRLTDAAPYPAQMHDCARALQFIRLNAKEYNIDTKRVGATGGSAGSGISQWLAAHDDLADPKSKDPVLRQSTRIQVAAVGNAQTSYDPRFIGRLFDTDEVESAFFPLYGLEKPEDINDPKFHPLFEDASPINHATKDDAPVLLHYSQANTPLPPGNTGKQHIHHPKFGFTLKEKLDELGIECVVQLTKDYPGQRSQEYLKFLLKHLDVETKQESK